MNLQQLYYFKTIAELEHYTRAAEKLLISQPSLSYAMSELERELGASLFVKQGRGVVLTKFGCFYEETGADGIEFTFEQRTTSETVRLFPLTYSLASRSSINLKQQSVFAIL